MPQGVNKSRGRKHSRPEVLEEEEDYSEDEDHGSRAKRRRAASLYLDTEAVDASDDEVDEDENEDNDFIEDSGANLQDNEDHDARQHHVQAMFDDDEDVDDLEKRVNERYGNLSNAEYEYEEEEVIDDLEQQSRLPSVRDPKLWRVKCEIGHERQVAITLMHKCFDKGSGLQIRSAIALDNVQNYIYVEADKEAHVRDACKGMRYVLTGSSMLLVPIKEMTDVLSAKSKPIEISEGAWVRIKSGTYKRDLAKVVHVSNQSRVHQRVTVKLIPRIYLQDLADKKTMNTNCKPPQQLMNVEEARAMQIPVKRKQDPRTGDYFEHIEGMKFKDGFLYKNYSTVSIMKSSPPSIDELQKFLQPGEDIGRSFSQFTEQRKAQFMKGDRVIIVKGDLKNLKGVVEKIEEETLQVKVSDEGLRKIVSVTEREVCKYFEPGCHVKVVSGRTEGETGTVLKVDGHLINIFSDTTKENLQVFSDDVVESSEVGSGKTRVGEYELHDLVLLNNNSFAVIISVKNEAFEVLEGVPERSELVLVKLGEIKYKIERKNNAEDRLKNIISVKDVVKVLEGPCKGKQGRVEHIYKDILFIYDRYHLHHAGFICARSQSCMVFGGSRANSDNDGEVASRFQQLRTLTHVSLYPAIMPRRPQSESGGRCRGGIRGRHPLIGTNIKIRLGLYKGYKGKVKDIKGASVQVELESQMKIITVNRDQISNDMSCTALFPGTPCGAGSETPMYPYMTPMRYSEGTLDDGMRTPTWNRLC
ncbi:Transcription elongation factor SPT5 [Heracleum sosnowskyi]|uniref:Transcription elongation factor SPT5 n=1 Tax=Heracleum sosnowskyi TaxID=360622 RepID=A0AAD8JGV4_9APIA|nr:Transcription elongation factor SPT5 [Heracleum sosnowskyi]